jgi:uncharacterized SAM-dependent methyltransferase
MRRDNEHTLISSIFDRFILNGLENANKILGENVFNLDDWYVIGEYVYDIAGGRHQAFYAPKKDLVVKGVHIQEGERVQVEQSLKYSEEESEFLWKGAGLKEVKKWSASDIEYSKSYFQFAFVSVNYS